MESSERILILKKCLSAIEAEISLIESGKADSMFFLFGSYAVPEEYSDVCAGIRFPPPLYTLDQAKQKTAIQPQSNQLLTYQKSANKDSKPESEPSFINLKIKSDRLNEPLSHVIGESPFAQSVINSFSTTNVSISDLTSVKRSDYQCNDLLKGNSNSNSDDIAVADSTQIRVPLANSSKVSETPQTQSDEVKIVESAPVIDVKDLSMRSQGIGINENPSKRDLTRQIDIIEIKLKAGKDRAENSDDDDASKRSGRKKRGLDKLSSPLQTESEDEGKKFNKASLRVFTNANDHDTRSQWKKGKAQDTPEVKRSPRLSRDIT